MGVPIEASLKGLSDRFPGRDLEVVVQAVTISRKVGSNLAEAFDRVSEMVRTRAALRDKLSALTTQGRMQGWIAISMPFVMTLALSILAPGYLTPLFSTPVGQAVTGVAILMMALGGAWILKISRTEFMQ
jgi:tight adherence protein B